MTPRKGEVVRLALGGMDTRLQPAEGTAALIENLRYNPGDATWSVVEGTVSIGSLSTTGVGLHWFQPRPNLKYCVVERRTAADTNALSWLNLQSGTLTAIATRRRVENNDGEAESFMELGRWLYFTSRGNALQRWDGRRTVPVGFDRAAPALEAYGPDQGVDLFDRASGVYGAAWNLSYQRGVGERLTDAAEQAPFRYAYGLTMLNELGQESPMSALAWVSGESDYTDGRKMILLRIPRLPAHCRGFRIWRSINVAGVEGAPDVPMYLHSAWPTAHGCTLVDHAPDYELGEEWDPDSVGPVPLGARAMAWWQGAVWLGGMVDDGAVLRYSAPSLPEQFPEVNRLPIGSRSTGPIVAVLPVPRGLVVWKQGGTYIVKGDPINGYRVEVVDERVGCSARRSPVAVPDLGVLWLHESGPKLLTGTLDDEQPTRVQGIADALSGYWRRMVQGTRIEAAVSVYDPTHHEVWFHLPHTGDNRPSLGLVLHTTTGAWSVRRDWNIAAFSYFRGAMYAVGWDKANVYKFTRGSRTPNLSAGSTITGLYASNPLERLEPMTADRVTVLGRALGSGSTFYVDTRVDRAQTWTVQTETARPSVHLMRDAPEWGTALWSASAYWDDEGATLLPVSVRTPAGRQLQVRVRSSTRLALAGLEVSVQPVDGGPPVLERR